MVCFEAGQICGECRENNEEVRRKAKDREDKRRQTEYMHPDRRAMYHGYDVLTLAPKEAEVGEAKTDSKGRIWVRIK